MLPLQIRSLMHSPARAHLVGLCGAGMKALAEYLSDRGWQVTGCDGDPDPSVIRSLQKIGIEVQQGHSEQHLDPHLDVLIFSAAVREENCERQQARNLKIPQFSYIEVLAELSRMNQTVAIAGTHGKSTTTAMLGQILRSAGRSDSVICGAELRGLGRSGWAGRDSTLIVEACEFRKHFVELHPQLACVLGIEPDHFDCYPTLQAAEQAYREFVQRLPAQGTLIFRSDCSSTKRVVRDLSVSKISFSLTDSGADWQVVDQQLPPQETTFRLKHRDSISKPIHLNVPGLHNVQNALAAAACAGELGLSLDEITTGLSSFPGLKRRFERRDNWRAAIVIDDYAHHPTEIRATLLAARQMFPAHRLICLFQPHQLSRTQALLQEFAAALSLADLVYLLPVYAAREIADNQQTVLTHSLLAEITAPAGFISTLDQVWGTVQTDAGPDAVILTLGAGTLSRVYHEFTD